jgi:hypothetical protein
MTASVHFLAGAGPGTGRFLMQATWDSTNGEFSFLFANESSSSSAEKNQEEQQNKQHTVA